MWGFSRLRSTAMAVWEESSAQDTGWVSPRLSTWPRGSAAIGAVSTPPHRPPSGHGSAAASESSSLTSGRRAADCWLTEGHSNDSHHTEEPT